jgi:NTP pyrophosphatase (non-canonical NTP hydrolase)
VDRGRLSLDDAQKLLDRIYGSRNQERFGESYNSGLHHMWLQVVKHGCQMARAVRKEQFALLLDELPKAVCWYSGFCSLIDIKIETIVWEFFPFVCPTCYKERCVCGTEKEPRHRKRQKDRTLLAEFRRLNAPRRPRTLDAYVEMFGCIYGKHADSINMHGIFLHFAEELGEVAEELDKSRGTNRQTRLTYSLKGELADVFSWIAKLSWKANQYAGGFTEFKEKVSLAKLVLEKYAGGCPDCGNERCSTKCKGWLG